MRGIKHNNLYKFYKETITDFVAKTLNAYIREFELWNMFLGHIGKRSLMVLSKRNLQCGFVAKELNVCM